MFCFAPKSGRRSRTDSTQARGRRPYAASFETVEDRKLLSSLTAVSWNSGGQTHSEVFAIGFNNAVSVSKDGGGFVSEGGYLKSISAGTDWYGNPEVYGIGADNAVWVNDNGAGWVSRGGYVKSISASVNNTVFAIGGDNAGWINRGGTSWNGLGGYVKSISAGTDWYGNPEVYGIGTDNAVYASDNGGGWVSRGGYVTAISASVNNTVFAIGGDNGGWINRGGTSWNGLGGYVRAISAGTDSYGNPEVFGIGGDAATYASDNGGGWVSRGGYVTELAGTAQGTVYARGGDVAQVFVSYPWSSYSYIDSVPLANPAAASSYSPAPAGAALFNNGQPSYLDMQQGAVGDCWLDASLAEVAARNPQDIKNMFVYDGTTVDNGATVGLYSVRLFSPNGVGFYVQVDTALPSGGGYYNRVGNALGTQSLWTALAEKAYAEANALGLVTTSNPDQGSYAALNSGWPAWALQAITGDAASQNAINPTNIASAWNAGQFVVLCTSTPASSAIVGSHCYAVVDYNASSSQPFEVFNAWGTQSNGYAPGQTGRIYGLFTANSAFISQNFTSQGIGSGAANVSDPAGPVDQILAPTTLDDAGSRKFSLARGNGTAIRPILGMTTVGGPLSLS